MQIRFGRYSDIRLAFKWMGRICKFHRFIKDKILRFYVWFTFSDACFLFPMSTWWYTITTYFSENAIYYCTRVKFMNVFSSNLLPFRALRCRQYNNVYGFSAYFPMPLHCYNNRNYTIDAFLYFYVTPDICLKNICQNLLY